MNLESERYRRKTDELIMKKADLANLMLTGLSEGKQRNAYLINLSKWMAEQRLGCIVRGQTLIRVTNDRKVLRAIIAQGL